jgi:hypothetical protein
MPELVAVLSASRDKDHENRKFLAALKGVDLDKEMGKSAPTKSNPSQPTGNAWENMKARANSKGLTSDGNDVLSLSGTEAARQGFGIGMGLDFENAVDPSIRAAAEAKAKELNSK